MILCDPFACNTLVLSIMRNLQELLSQDALPRVSILSCTTLTGTLCCQQIGGSKGRNLIAACLSYINQCISLFECT